MTRVQAERKLRKLTKERNRLRGAIDSMMNRQAAIARETTKTLKLVLSFFTPQEKAQFEALARTFPITVVSDLRRKNPRVIGHLRGRIAAKG